MNDRLYTAMSIKEQTRDLWKICFDDSEAFVDMYFACRYADRINKVLMEEERVVSACQLIPYTLSFGPDSKIPIAYVSGACTHPAYRKQGRMRQLLAAAHQELFDQSVCFSTLIPASASLREYYGRSGYTSCFCYDIRQLATTDRHAGQQGRMAALEVHPLPLQDPLDVAACAFFQERMGSRLCCIQHTEADLQVVRKDLALEGGSLYELAADGIRVGLAFCRPADTGVLHVDELLLADGWEVDEVLLRLGELVGVSSVCCQLPPVKGMHELGMARVICVEAALRHFARLHSSESFFIQVVGDEDLPDNNDYYQLSGGGCRRGFRSSVVYTVFTIPRLTRFLFSGLHPYMSLMLN